MLYWTGAVLLEKYKQKEGMLWLIIYIQWGRYNLFLTLTLQRANGKYFPFCYLLSVVCVPKWNIFITCVDYIIHSLSP